MIIGCTGENGKDFVGSQGFIYDMNNVKPTCNELDDDLIKKNPFSICLNPISLGNY